MVWTSDYENENGNPYNLVKYMRLYDETIDAIQTGLGNNGIALNPGNMMLTPYLQPENSSWIPDIAYMLNHDGNPVTRFCVSLYGNIAGDGTFHSSGVQLDADPRELKLFIDSIRNIVNSYYPNALISTEEGELALDEYWHEFGFCGSNLGSAYLAGVLKNGYDVNLNRYTLWQLTENGLKAPAYNVVEMYKRMRDQKRIRLDAPATSYPYIDGISSKSNVCVSTMVFSYFPSHESTKTNSVAVNFSGFRKNGKYLLKTYVVDKNRSNYFDEFYSDIGVSTRQQIRNLMIDTNAYKVSEYHPDVIQYMDTSTQQTWRNNWGRYRNASNLERIEKAIIKTDASGIYTKTISLDVNSIYLFEIENCDNVELY